MKKSMSIISMAVVLAAAMYAQDVKANAPATESKFHIGQSQQGKMPEQTTITGTLTITKNGDRSFATLKTADGKEYALMTPGDRPADAPRGNPPAGGNQAFGGNPPAGMNPPSTVKLSDLAPLDGKTVSITGFVPPAPPADGAAKAPRPDDANRQRPTAKDGMIIVASYKAN